MKFGPEKSFSHPGEGLHNLILPGKNLELSIEHRFKEISLPAKLFSNSCKTYFLPVKSLYILIIIKCTTNVFHFLQFFILFNRTLSYFYLYASMGWRNLQHMQKNKLRMSQLHFLAIKSLKIKILKNFR